MHHGRNILGCSYLKLTTFLVFSAGESAFRDIHKLDNARGPRSDGAGGIAVWTEGIVAEIVPVFSGICSVQLFGHNEAVYLSKDHLNLYEFVNSEDRVQLSEPGLAEPFDRGVRA